MPPCQTATWRISEASLVWSKPRYCLLAFLFVLITRFSLDDYLQVETLITGGQVAETGGVINQV